MQFTSHGHHSNFVSIHSEKYRSVNKELTASTLPNWLEERRLRTKSLKHHPLATSQGRIIHTVLSYIDPKNENSRQQQSEMAYAPSDKINPPQGGDIHFDIMYLKRFLFVLIGFGISIKSYTRDNLAKILDFA